MSFELENDSPDGSGALLSFKYPKLPENVDFETFRKTDSDWSQIIGWYNRDSDSGKEKVKHRRERFVFLQWPRNPEGPPMKITPPGKDTGNGCKLWGATLYDFYRIYRVPSCPSLSCISTSSKLAAWVKETGEEDWCREQLRQAEVEESPRQIPPYDIGNWLEVLEEQVWKGKTGKSLQIDRTDNKTGTAFLYRPSLYPAPWPLRPFSAPTARLQKKFPFSYLPQKLIVHDPWHTLEVTSAQARKYYGTDGAACEWGTVPDVVHTYRIKFTEEGNKRQNLRSIGPRPAGYQVCPEAHLYITPRRCIGKGHHSYVYQVELELPRDMLVQPKTCVQCAMKKLLHDRKIIREGGDVRRLQNAPNGIDMQEQYSLMFKNNRPFEEYDRKDTRFNMLQYMNYQSRPPFCEHLDTGVLAPPSQKVSVTAKLSIPDDEKEAHMQHLYDEAATYQSFPDHVYEHWNGYNVIAPMREPTPVGAVVPQFYGFYEADETNERVKEGKYMSPILLLEHCGVQVNPEMLSMDQRQECFSLLKRLHIAGYKHNSVFQRNILMQYGPLQMSSFQRSTEHARFRLIDFGRTQKESNWLKLAEEYGDANKKLMLEMY